MYKIAKEQFQLIKKKIGWAFSPVLLSMFLYGHIFLSPYGMYPERKCQ